jgi:hypothetical protein
LPAARLTVVHLSSFQIESLTLKMSNSKKSGTAKVSFCIAIVTDPNHRILFFLHNYACIHVFFMFLTLLCKNVQDQKNSNALKAVAAAKAERQSLGQVARDLSCDGSVITKSWVRYHYAKRRDPNFHNGNHHAFRHFLHRFQSASVQSRVQYSFPTRNYMCR